MRVLLSVLGISYVGILRNTSVIDGKRYRTHGILLAYILGFSLATGVRGASWSLTGNLALSTIEAVLNPKDLLSWTLE